MDAGAPAGLKVRVDVEFTVEGSGRVSSAKVLSGAEAGPQLRQCLVQAITGWQFPALGAEKTVVSYPFRFVPPEP